MRYWLIMPAAGSGRRFGEALPKQYVPLAGRTVIEWALAPFLADPRCTGIVVAVAPEDAHWPRVAEHLGASGRPPRLASAPRNAGAQIGSVDVSGEVVHTPVKPSPPGAAGGQIGSVDVSGEVVHTPVDPGPPGAASGQRRDAGALGVRARAWPPALWVAAGGAERSHSVLNALRALSSVAGADDWVLVHDAARPCLPASDLDALLQRLESHSVGGLLATRAADTLKRAAEGNEVEQTVDRTSLWRALTPQMFRYQALVDALDHAITQGRAPTDEAQAIEWMGQKPMLVEGSAQNIKVTHARDLVLADVMLRAASPQNAQVETMRVGSGIDVHAFGPGDYVTLAGVRIPYTRGVVAHSDGDVILHALCDALLGAAGLGDIGQHFRDDDPQWKGADSKQFVTAVLGMLKERGMRVLNADVTVLAEAPRLAKYRAEMRRTLAELLEVDELRVNVKATTTERLGFIGRSEGLAAQAIVAVSDA